MGALLLETRATLTGECLAMHDRLMGALIARAKWRHLETFADSAQTINEKVRLFAKVGHALVEARKAAWIPSPPSKR